MKAGQLHPRGSEAQSRGDRGDDHARSSSLPEALARGLFGLQNAWGRLPYTIYNASFDAVDIPTNLSLPAFVLGKMNSSGTALIDGPTGKRVTYSELAAQIKKLASALLRP